MFDLGSVVPIATNLTDSDGVPTNAATAVLTITLPDGTTTSPAVPVPGTVGQYQVDYPTEQAGRHTVQWIFTGPTASVTDVFDVRPAASVQLMSLADARKHLNKSSSVDDEEIRRFIEAATTAVEARIGPVVRREHTASVRADNGSFVLPHTQVLDVSAVVRASDGSSAVDVADLDVDTPSGRVYLTSGAYLSERLRVTYTVGRPQVDPAISLAAGIILAHLWETQRGNAGRPGVFGDSEPPTNPEATQAYFTGFAIPRRAAELLAKFETAAVA